MSITIKFNAFIPKSLGKPLLSYFQNDIRFNPRKMFNFEEFKQKLIAADREGYTWLPEPFDFGAGHYCGTDTIDFHDKESKHDNRLSVAMSFDLSKIGNITDNGHLFQHSMAHKGAHANNQHSGVSHRIQAYIQPVYRMIDEFNDEPSPPIGYKGICEDKIESLRAEEIKLVTNINNTNSYTNYSGVNDITIVKVTASAGYPFISIAPNIDFELEITLKCSANRKEATITVRGTHNMFPAYELVIDGLIFHHHNPIKYGYYAPSFESLNRNISIIPAMVKKSIW